MQRVHRVERITSGQPGLRLAQRERRSSDTGPMCRICVSGLWRLRSGPVVAPVGLPVVSRAQCLARGRRRSSDVGPMCRCIISLVEAPERPHGRSGA
ncbi:hypothetical protein NDU88_011186 [Pleurodeles waltl]|uniref:Uncharacterized protein n=1 Tax=Pleurodeles waltl TaxID=8319 RepID=A0AAV7QZC4_PLEWA|nr:hypothetical protein NDU88_011186 [Pleurodeles waltl]